MSHDNRTTRQADRTEQPRRGRQFGRVGGEVEVVQGGWGDVRPRSRPAARRNVPATTGSRPEQRELPRPGTAGVPAARHHRNRHAPPHTARITHTPQARRAADDPNNTHDRQTTRRAAREHHGHDTDRKPTTQNPELGTRHRADHRPQAGDGHIRPDTSPRPTPSRNAEPVSTPGRTQDRKPRSAECRTASDQAQHKARFHMRRDPKPHPAADQAQNHIAQRDGGPGPPPTARGAQDQDLQRTEVRAGSSNGRGQGRIPPAGSAGPCSAGGRGRGRLPDVPGSAGGAGAGPRFAA